MSLFGQLNDLLHNFFVKVALFCPFGHSVYSVLILIYFTTAVIKISC